MPAKKVKKPLAHKSRRFVKPEPRKIYPRLDLHGVYLRQCKALGIKANTDVVKMIPTGKDSYHTLTELDVSMNYLGDLGVRALLEVIRLSSCLNTVNLSNSGVTDSTVALLCAVLMDHTSVSTVDLSENKISQESVSLIRNLLRNNKCITKFETSGNQNIYEAGRRDIEMLAAANLGARRGGSFVEAIQREILSRFSEPKPNLLWRKQDLKMWIGDRKIKAIPTPNPDGWITVSIFTSATFSDFHTELHVINNIIVPEINSKLRKYQIHLLPIDLHQSKAYNCDSIENIQNVKYCIGTLRRSSDIFIGLHGHNLGWVPSLDEIPTYELYDTIRKISSDGPASITYLQCMEAGKWSSKDVRLCFQYFRHSNVIADIPEALKGMYLEKSNRRFILANEKKKLKEITPPALQYDGYGAHFKSIDPYGQVHLCRYSDFEETCQSDIFNSLEVMFPGVLGRSKTSPVVPKDQPGNYIRNVNQYFTFTKKNYTGMDTFVEEARKVLHPDVRNVTDTRLLMITGPRGCGLTSSIWSLAKFTPKTEGNAEDPNTNTVYYLYYFVSLSSLTHDSTDIRSLFRELYYQSLEVLKSEGKPPPDSDITLTAIRKGNLSSMRKYFWSHLSTVTKEINKSIVVLIDDISCVTGTTDPINSVLGKRCDIPTSVRVGISTPIDDKELISILQEIDPSYKTIAVPHLGLRSQKHLLTSFLSPYNDTLADDILPLVAPLQDSNLPLFLKLLSNECLHTSRHVPVQRLISTTPYTLPELINEMFTRRESKEQIAGGKLYLVRLISLLCVARNGISDQEARELLMKDFKENCEENYLQGTTTTTGYLSSSEASEKHRTESSEIRRRLWGRWANYNPRLLPGSIWSRIIFELRPFTQRRLDQTRTSDQPQDYNINTYVISWCSQSVARSARTRYLSSTRRMVRFHAQLGNFYRGKSYLPNNVLWRKGLRETIHHLSKAWLWDTLLDYLRPSLIFYAAKEQLLCQLLRDIEAAEDELDNCIEAHKRNMAMQNKLLSKLPHIREYRSIIRTYGDMCLKRPARALACMMSADPETRVSKQIRKLYDTQGISYIAPPVPKEKTPSSVSTFYENRKGVPFTGSDEGASRNVQIMTCTDMVLTWVAPLSHNSRVVKSDTRKYLRPAVVFVWSAETTEFLRELTCEKYTDSYIVACAMSKDETQLVVGTECWKSFLFDIQTGDLISILTLPPRGSSNLAGFLFLREEPKRPDGQPTPKQVSAWDDFGRYFVWNNSDDKYHIINADTVNETPDKIVSVAASPASAKVVFAHDQSTSCVLYCLAMPSTPIKVSTLTVRESPQKVFFVKETSTHVITVTDRHIIMWYADTGEQLIQISLSASLADLAVINYHLASNLLVVVDLGHQVCTWSVLYDSGCTTIQEQLSIPVKKEWMLDHGESVWDSSAEFVVGTSRTSFDIKFCCLSPDSRGPSHTQAILPSDNINVKTASGIGGPATLLSLSQVAAHPSYYNRFYLTDSSSGIPFVMDVTKHKDHSSPLSLPVLD